MIGFVIVSHSRKIAEGVCDLARQVAQDRVRIAAAGGTNDPEHPIGTDAFQVLEAIESVYSGDGVLVMTDLGSAVLSAETALEMLGEGKRARIRLPDAPLVEGTVAAVSQAAAGASLEELVAQPLLAAAPAIVPAPAGNRVPTDSAVPAPAAAERLVTVPNPLGLHARPAARLIRLARSFEAPAVLENLTRSAGPAHASGMHAILCLSARQGDHLRIRAHGPDAAQAVAALASFVEGGCGDSAEPQAHASGVAASAGIAIGPARRLRPAAVRVTPRRTGEPAVEAERLGRAIREVHEETRAWGRHQDIFEAQSLFLEDPAVTEPALRRVGEDHWNAESAWQLTADELIARLNTLDDPYLRARAADVADAANRVARKLAGPAAVPAQPDEPAILVAEDVTPSEVRELDPGGVLGLCLAAGNSTSHALILVRAMGIPAVVGVGPALSGIADGTLLVLDAESGRVLVSPPAEQTAAFEQKRQAWLGARRAALRERSRPACTGDGKRIRILANVNRVTGVPEALDAGAEGIGVLRTEFLFLDRAAPPSEEEQLAAYRVIADALGPRPLVIRTLDAGGDKNVPYAGIGVEANPFLGWRGIRLTLGRPHLLRTQLRAILRATEGRAIEVLFPMISSLDEVRQAKSLLAEVASGIGRQDEVKFGAMIEVPSAVAIADLLAREVDSFSIGTNDLVQYLMAADRTNTRVAGIADPLQPAVLRMLRQTVAAGRNAGIEVTLCGELAADRLATPLLLGLGIERFSVSAPLIPELKQGIARWSTVDAEAIAREALQLDTADAVRSLLARRLQR